MSKNLTIVNKKRLSAFIVKEINNLPKYAHIQELLFPYRPTLFQIYVDHKSIKYYKINLPSFKRK